MNIFFREFGRGKPFVILHGLYGTSDNWVSIGRTLAEHFRVILVDQRNHGQSFHSPSHTYQDLSDYLVQFFKLHDLRKANVLGHSMGGKAAMLFASQNPQMVEKLVVVDISPGGYGNSTSLTLQRKIHEKIISSLLALDIDTITSRQQADEVLAKSVADVRIRQFLLKNLQRDEKGKFYWLLNLDAISANIDALMGSLFSLNERVSINTPTLFVKGERSPYITQQHFGLIDSIFVNSQIVTIPNAGHWLHAEQPNQFLEVVTGFLKNEG